MFLHWLLMLCNTLQKLLIFFKLKVNLLLIVLYPLLTHYKNTLNRDHMAINALCEHLLNSLEQRFGYLKDSPLHQAATVLDPNINLSFTDNNEEGKVFTFTSSEVKEIS